MCVCVCVSVCVCVCEAPPCAGSVSKLKDLPPGDLRKIYFSCYCNKNIYFIYNCNKRTSPRGQG